MREINADFDAVRGRLSRHPTFCVGAGRAGEVLRKDFCSQLETVITECGFKYLRFHGIFHDEMGVYQENKDGNPVYNWQYADMVYDSILERGIKPFVEIGFMPGALASGEKTVFWWKANVTPPKDFDKWYDLVRSFVVHLEERYGREEVLTWYFEIWNEPNHPAFFSGTREEYFKLYGIAAEAIKCVCSRYRVGGPATAGSEWVREFIAYCCRNEVPLDFISTHTYGGELVFDEFGNKQSKVMDPMVNVIGGPQMVFGHVVESAKPDIEIHYTEWSSSCSARDPVHDSYIQAPYILYCMKRVENYVTSMSYWTFTDIFEEVGIPPSPLHGGFGLINLQSLKKPAFFAYKYFNMLGDEELANDDPDSWVCRDKRGVQALFWNYTRYNQDTCNALFFKRDIKPKELEPVKLSLSGLSEGDYQFEAYLTGYEANDIYGYYMKAGGPANLSKAQVEELSKLLENNPVVSEVIRVTEQGKFEYQFPMRENDMYLITLELVD